MEIACTCGHGFSTSSPLPGGYWLTLPNSVASSNRLSFLRATFFLVVMSFSSLGVGEALQLHPYPNQGQHDHLLTWWPTVRRIRSLYRKLKLDLVAERLEELKAEEEKNAKRRLETEERIHELPEAQDALTKSGYEDLKKDLSAFIEDAPPPQKRQFLSKFIRSITVHPEKMVVEYVPPVLSKRKTPGQGGQGFSLIEVASPTRRLQNYENLILRISIRK